ncbi:MAG: electron transport complex subunit RsxB [Pseudomonadales bacterium]|nr:electron transport complex subunit RsxB [Pseudomonadales bacterium]
MTGVFAILALLVMGAIFGAVLGFASIRFEVDEDPVVDQINSILPQTQCGQCGHPGCKPYAEAIAAGELHNRCPPGGEDTIVELSDLLNRDVIELDEESGEVSEVKKVAIIIEEECIGCTKCIQACPVDAILGAAKKMHTVIEDECTGCDLCLEPCPVDCIILEPVKETQQDWIWTKPNGSDGVPQMISVRTL